MTVSDELHDLEKDPRKFLKNRTANQALLANNHILLQHLTPEDILNTPVWSRYRKTGRVSYFDRKKKQMTQPYFTEDQIRKDLAEVRQMLIVGERVHDFVASLFETAQDGEIEWYEFLDFLLVLRSTSRPLTRTGFETDMKLARKEGLSRPWSFDENGVCSMPGDDLEVAKRVFRDLDTNRDGTLDNGELYGLS